MVPKAFSFVKHLLPKAICFHIDVPPFIRDHRFTLKRLDVSIPWTVTTLWLIIKTSYGENEWEFYFRNHTVALYGKKWFLGVGTAPLSPDTLNQSPGLAPFKHPASACFVMVDLYLPPSTDAAGRAGSAAAQRG